MRQQNLDSVVTAKDEQAGADTAAFLFLRWRRIFHAIFQRQTRARRKSTNDPERSQCCRIDAGCDRQKMIALVTRDRGAGERAHGAGDGVGGVSGVLRLGVTTW